jgi:hypothetical protein
MAWLPSQNSVFHVQGIGFDTIPKTNRRFNDSEIAWLTSCGDILDSVALQRSVIVFLRFQSNVAQKATRTQLKWKDINIKVKDFENQDKMKPFKFFAEHRRLECCIK